MNFAGEFVAPRQEEEDEEEDEETEETEETVTLN